jgi:hypothetical protein
MKHVKHKYTNTFVDIIQLYFFRDYMPFIHSYNGAMKILNSIGKGTCKGKCKQTWIRNFKYALRSNKNPLRLSNFERKNMTKKNKRNV